MDNFFQLLIFLFVIYTIFNTVIGKKKSQKADNTLPQNNPQDGNSAKSPQPKYSSGDILEDLFGLKIPKTGGEYETYPQNKYPSNLETELPEIDNQPGVEKFNTPDVDYDKLPSLELQQNVVSTAEYHTAYEKSSNINPRTIEIINKIKNPSTLRELYLISEILNKPKAFRK
jgi:hypothetical protein